MTIFFASCFSVHKINACTCAVGMYRLMLLINGKIMYYNIHMGLYECLYLELLTYTFVHLIFMYIAKKLIKTENFCTLLHHKTFTKLCMPMCCTIRHLFQTIHIIVNQGNLCCVYKTNFFWVLY